MIVPAYPGRVAPLEFFMARKFGMGFFRVKFWSKRFLGVLFEALEIFFFFFFWGGGVDFCLQSIIPVTRNPKTPPPPAPLGKNREEKQNPFQIVPTEQVGTLPVDFTTSNEKLSN